MACEMPKSLLTELYAAPYDIVAEGYGAIFTISRSRMATSLSQATPAREPASAAKLAAVLCQDMKANDVVLLNLQGVTDMTDFFFSKADGYCSISWTSWFTSFTQR